MSRFFLRFTSTTYSIVFISRLRHLLRRESEVLASIGALMSLKRCLNSPTRYSSLRSWVVDKYYTPIRVFHLCVLSLHPISSGTLKTTFCMPRSLRHSLSWTPLKRVEAAVSRAYLLDGIMPKRFVCPVSCKRQRGC